MRYLSVCSGIEAASVAWKPLGWECAGVSEIDKFPRAVLQHRLGVVPVDDDHRWQSGQNFTPLFGDFTQIEAHHVGPVDLLVGGTPCQSFSIAGKRLGLDDPRGNLTLEFFALAERVRPTWIVWENVPGVLSHDDGRTFGTVLGLMGECGFRWAYRTLDAQYVRTRRFGRAVPQRRRRVFLVGYSGTADIHPRAVLFDRESLRGNPAPRREAGQGFAPTIAARTRGGGGLGTDFDCDGGLVTAARMVAFGEYVDDGTGRGTPIVPVQQPFSIMPMNSGKDYKARETDVAQPIMAGGPVGGNQGGDFVAMQHAIAIQERAVSENPDAGPDGKGWRDDGAAYTLEARQVSQAVAFAQNTRDEVRLFGGDGAIAGALSAEPGMKQTTYVAFTAKDHGGDAVEGISPTLRAGGHTGSHANAGVMPAIAFQERGRTDGRSLEHQEGVAYALTAPSGGGRAQERNIASAWGVRRLTPTEWARLQGFPDDWARIPWRGKPAEECPDGPQYKCYGNSMACNVMVWIGERIEHIRSVENANVE